MRFPDGIDTECAECGKEMTVADSACYDLCLGCTSEEDRKRFAEIVDARNTLSNDSSVDSTLESDGRGGSGGGRMSQLEKDRKEAENNDNVKILEF